MMSKIIFWCKYLIYNLFAKHQNGHGVHSPFLYELLTEVIEQPHSYYAYFDISDLKLSLYFSKKFKPLKIKELINESIDEKYGELLFRLVNFFKPPNILEFGTSLGISTLYLASPSRDSQIISVEKDAERLKIAKQNFSKLKKTNISVINNDFEKSLPEIFAKTNILDFVLFDGNHSGEEMLNLFLKCLQNIDNQSIFVFTDIHMDSEKEKYWKKIIENSEVTLSVDLFFLGIIFFKKELSKQHFTIKF